MLGRVLDNLGLVRPSLWYGPVAEVPWPVQRGSPVMARALDHRHELREDFLAPRESCDDRVVRRRRRPVGALSASIGWRLERRGLPSQTTGPLWSVKRTEVDAFGRMGSVDQGDRGTERS